MQARRGERASKQTLVGDRGGLLTSPNYALTARSAGGRGGGGLKKEGPRAPVCHRLQPRPSTRALFRPGPPCPAGWFSLTHREGGKLGDGAALRLAVAVASAAQPSSSSSSCGNGRHFLLLFLSRRLSPAAGGGTRCSAQAAAVEPVVKMAAEGSARERRRRGRGDWRKERRSRPSSGARTSEDSAFQLGHGGGGEATLTNCWRGAAAALTAPPLEGRRNSPRSLRVAARFVAKGSHRSATLNLFIY